MDAEQAITLPTQRMIARIEGSIGWMIFNNPDRRNAVSSEMWEAIPLIMDRFEQDPAVRTIVLRGAGDRGLRRLVPISASSSRTVRRRKVSRSMTALAKSPASD